MWPQASAEYDPFAEADPEAVQVHGLVYSMEYLNYISLDVNFFVCSSLTALTTLRTIWTTACRNCVGRSRHPKCKSRRGAGVETATFFEAEAITDRLIGYSACASGNSFHIVPQYFGRNFFGRNFFDRNSSGSTPLSVLCRRSVFCAI